MQVEDVRSNAGQQNNRDFVSQCSERQYSNV